MAKQALAAFLLMIIFAAVFTINFPGLWWLNLPALAIVILGCFDMAQKRHAIRRNFPVIGHLRYLLESIRPEINQYFVESNINGTPFSRETRSVVYQRAKKQRDTIPFGTRHDLYEPGREWVLHSMFPKKVRPDSLRVKFGGPQCSQPYEGSIFMISGMSFGSISSRAVEALNLGARLGGFPQNSGEGGISKYHLIHGGDLIWQIGTGYFGCRRDDGTFDIVAFKEMARRKEIKMIEIKLSQGAKPSLGGLLPAAKLTPEIASARKVSLGADVVSPARHSEFSDVQGFLHFIRLLRHASDGKPVGFKLCVGDLGEFESLCAAMAELKIYPDFITVDGAEGGTGAAPLEFSNYIGMPLADGLVHVRNQLVRYGLREHIRLIVSGKVTHAFDVVKYIALGADACASARGMMLALGCIQALRCDSNKCPTGIATQDPNLIFGLVVDEKGQRVAEYHKKTLNSVAQLLGSMGLQEPGDLRPEHIQRRDVSGRIINLQNIYASPEVGPHT